MGKAETVPEPPAAWPSLEDKSTMIPHVQTITGDPATASPLPEEENPATLRIPITGKQKTRSTHSKEEVFLIWTSC